MNDPSPVESPVLPKVLLLLKGLGAGGAEVLAVDAARPRPHDRLVHEVAYLLAHKDALVPRLTDHSVPVRCYDQRSWWDPRWLLRLRGDLRRPEVAVVHSHAPVPAVGARLLARTIARRNRPKVVTTLHNTWSSLHPLTRTAYHLTSRLDDAHLSVSEGVHASLPASIADRDRVIVHGVDVAQVRSTADRAGARAELGVGDQQLLVGTVANLRRTKGYPDLLAAASEVTQRSKRTSFVIVGDGPMRSELEHLRDTLDLDGRVLFTGRRLDATRLMSAFDLFCLPSHHEGLPVVLMEALALGIPVVASRVGGIGELITDGVEGRLVPPRHPEDLAAALSELLDDDVALATCAAAARSRGADLDTAPALRAVQTTYSRLLDRDPASEPVPGPTEAS